MVARAAETPPTPYHGSPVIPYAKQIGEHRFRSPRNYDDTLEYYRKIYMGNRDVTWEKIINSSDVRAVFLKNLRTQDTWEGLNIYEYKGSTIVFVVFTDKQLEKLAKKKEAKATKETSKKPGK